MANEKDFGIDIKQEIARGSYSNLAIVGHSNSEFVVDFATILPGMTKPEVTNRIIMTPENTKRLILALQDNIRKFEAQNGPISVNNEPKPPFPVGNMGSGKKS